MDHSEERKLFSLMQQGDKDALSTLYLHNFDQLLHFGIRISSDKFLTEECIQNMFMYIFEAKEKLSLPQHVKAYLFSSLRRRILDSIKTKRKSSSIVEDHYYKTNILFASNEITPLNDLDNNRENLLAEELNKLPWRQREAIYLRYYNNLNTNEIADIMGVANQTILNTLYQALKKVRSNLNLHNIR